MVTIPSGMSKVKTTVYLDAADYQRLKRLADTEGSSAAELIRVAVARYLEVSTSSAWPSWVGSVSSGDPEWAERTAERLDGFGES